MKIHLQTDQSQREHCLKMPRNSPRNSLTLSSSVDGAVLSKSPRRTKQALDCIQCSFRICCKVLVPIPTQTHHHLERFTTLTNSTRGQRSLGLQFLLTCAILVVVASFANGQQQKETPLPTVIVRGFLNYRTTVDGTVLLFTPDAGQQQQAPASAAQPKASSSMTRIEQTVAAATATSTHPLKSSLVYTETLAQPIEPTSTQAMATATDLFQTVHLDSNSFRHNNQNQNNNNQHQTPPQTIAADQRAGQPDEWRPIQMTPPLPKMTQPLPDKPAANSESASTTTSQPKPSVQADDVAVEPARQAGSSASSTPPSTSSETPPAAAPTGRPRRPSLGFSGQGLRPRVPGTAGAVSPSLQGRSRSTDGASTPNSINGIRRPGLASSSAASSNGGSSSGGAPARSQVATDPVVSANVSSAFQNRLSNASTRLKNRFKHRQPTATSSLPQPTTPSPAPSPSPSPTPQASSRPAAAAASSGSSASQPKQHNSLIAPESLLDVASSIEQPTSAARSQSLVPQSNRNGPAGSSELSSSGPAVGSDEIVAAAAAAPSSPTTEHQHQEQAISGQATSQNSNTPEQQQDSFVPMVASSPAASAEGEPIMEPMSPEQQAGMAALSRSGEQQPKSQNGELLGSDGPPDGQQARVLSGQLQQGSLSSGPLNLDALFLSDQPSSAGASGQGEPHNQASSEPAPSHLSRSASLPGYMRSHHHHNHTNGNLNGKLNGWLGQHHNKFVPRPAAKPHSDTNLSQQLAANIQQLAPTPVPPSPHNQPNNQNLMSQMSPQQDEATSSGGNSFNSTSADGSAQMGSNISMMLINNNDTTNSSSFTASSNNNNSSSEGLGPEPMSMQTITRTYSTILETTRTRLVPMQVKSSTGIITVTEDYIMTKMMTAYQTIPASAEFILADQQLSTRAPYEIFESSPSESESKIKSESVPPAAAAPAIVSGPIETQEQPISLDNSPKSANNWLHDFSNLDGPNLSPLSNDFSNAVSQQQLQQQQQQSMLAILEQQARDANLAPGFPLMSPNGEPLDQLASQLDPSSLLAEGAINIPDLNNPLVLAAAIQNPQLAAVILAAQQLKLKRQQQQQLQFQKPLLQQQQLQNQQLQPSYSTSFSTTVRPSTYTARDTMYTTRLVSFRDGRTVRTRTVSEPGSVIEQVLTTIVTETIPVTVTIKPTAVLGATGSPATALPTGPLGQVQSNQATINNALFATQLANILARRQQQLQTSFNSPSALINPNAGGMTQAASATPQQLLAFQQYINQQQKRQQQQNQQPQQQQQQQQQQQFQPNFQQLLQSMSSSNASTSSSSQAARQSGANSQSSASQSATAASPQQDQQHQATPALQQPPKSVVSSATPVANVLGGPLTTTLTSLQTRTYTVHNAFKTIFRTITSTVLIPTVLAAGSTLMPMLG